MKKRLLTAASVAAAVTLALTGCNSDDSTTGSSSNGPAGSEPSGDPFDQVVKYAECLQKNGLQVKIKQGDGFTLPRGYDPKKKESAEAACRSVAPPGMYDKPNAQQLDHDLKIAQCLRAQGVDVKDPTGDQPMLAINHPPDNLRELQEACEKKIDPDK